MTLSKIGVQMKSMAQEAIYRKALRLTSTAKGTTSTGQLVNIMSSDTNILQMFTVFILVLISAPFMIIICILLMITQIGQLTWIAIGILFVMLVIQGTCGGIVRKIRDKNMKFTDSRVKLLNEVLIGIRVIKYYCWERPFLGKIDEIREKEIKQIEKQSWIMACAFMILMNLVPYAIPFIIFSIYPSVEQKPLTPSVIFTTLSLLGILRMPFMMLPMCIMMYIQFRVSLKRINHFLSLDEVDSSLVYRNISSGEGSKPIEYTDHNGDKQTLTDYNVDDTPIVIQDGSFAWGDGTNVLKDINIKIKKGSLVAVVGRVGSGKTSFVSALIGEMTKNSGCCIVNGSVSFASQQAWMVNDTVRGNVLFGKEFEEERYKRALHVCCMEDDLKVLKGGEMCEIGDRGINLSGGQKARIGLARCVYSDTDIVIMDDPIAAVDAHVGKYLFNKCIKTELNGKTRILVTNALQYLPKCDYVIVINDNTIEAQGTYEEVKQKDSEFMKILQEQEVGRSSIDTGKTSRRDHTEAKKEKKESDEGQLVEEEEKHAGRIPLSAYTFYFKSCGLVLVILMLVLFILRETVNILTQFLLSAWSETPECKAQTANETDILTPECLAISDTYLSWYSYLIIGLSIFLILNALLNVPARISASRHIHKELSSKIMAAPIAFHDITPVGRILNRFNKDMDGVDNTLPQNFNQVVSMFLTVVGDIIQISITTKGIMIPVIFIVVLIFYFVQSYFRRTNTDIQRLESVSRSPIFEDFQAVLTGAPTIRAYGYQERFIQHMENRLTINNHNLLLFNYCGCWLTMRTDILAAGMSCIIAILSNGLRGFISASLLGVALNSSSNMSMFLKQCTRMLAQLEAQMNNVERVKFYIDTVEPEPPMIIEDHRPPEDWPTEGAIKFDNFEMRYRNGPKVLKGVNMDIHPMEKVGVVGRTGAGKSSLMVGLFRISECCGGAIYMDNIKLEDIGLEDVRRHLCIIPQDPVLFSASVRFNLDPFNESSDEEIWRVLEEVELKEAIDALPGKLDGDVHEGGSNFSVGQRQLICMARALLKRPKVLIMDEATASLDNETDGFLQTMIRKQFINCTVLTIAHRLNTIMDSDRVCVMDQGIVAEFDTPLNLLNNPNSIFSGMVVAANDPNLYTMVKGYIHKTNEEISHDTN
ncbi:hypothetical protein WA158_001559 [Blastocystis sp. Blastoise]